ncbi:hypothetical protein [Nostoc sp.]
MPAAGVAIAPSELPSLLSDVRVNYAARMSDTINNNDAATIFCENFKLIVVSKGFYVN